MASIPIYKDYKEDRNVRVVLSPISSNKFPDKPIKTCTVSSSNVEGSPQECIELSHKEILGEMIAKLGTEFDAKLEEQRKQLDAKVDAKVEEKLEENRKEQEKQLDAKVDAKVEVKYKHLQEQIDHLGRQLGVFRREIMPQCPMCKNENNRELEVLYCGHVFCRQCISDLKCNDCPFCDDHNPNRFVRNPETNSPCKPLYP